MKSAFMVLLLVASPLCSAQKWMDANGKVYYGTPPTGVHVEAVPMTGGAISSVGSQPPDPNFPPVRYAPVPSWREEMRNQEYERRRQEEERREWERNQGPDAGDRQAAIEQRREKEAIRSWEEREPVEERSRGPEFIRRQNEELLRRAGGSSWASPRAE